MIHTYHLKKYMYNFAMVYEPFERQRRWASLRTYWGRIVVYNVKFILDFHFHRHTIFPRAASRTSACLSVFLLTSNFNQQRVS